MNAPRLRLAPQFAFLGCVVAAAVLAVDHPRSAGNYLGAIAYVGIVGLVGHRVRENAWWIAHLFAANVVLLTFGTWSLSSSGEHFVLSCLGAFGVTLCALPFFYAFVQGASEFHDARERSLAAGAERRFVTMAALIPFDFVIVFYAVLERSGGLRWMLVAASAATKVLYLASNEWTVRRIRRARPADLSATTVRPSSDVAQIDLGVGEQIGVRRDAGATYREGATTTLAVLGDVEASVKLVRGRSAYYAKLVAAMWLVLALIAGLMSRAL